TRDHAGFQSWAEMGLAASTAPALPTSARNNAPPMPIPSPCRKERAIVGAATGRRFPAPFPGPAPPKSSLLTSAYSDLHNKYSTSTACTFFLFLFHPYLELLSVLAAILRHPGAVSHQN